MAIYIVRRLLFLPIIVFLATLIVFLLLQLLPPAVRATVFIKGDIYQVQSIDQIIEEQGLDQPIHVQWYQWIKAVFQGNWGWSKSASMSVLDAIQKFFPATLELALATLFPLLFGGIWMGIVSAKYQDRWPDHITRIVAISSASVPVFIIGLVLLMIVFGRLGWVSDGRLGVIEWMATMDPSYVRYTGMHTLDSLINRRLDLFWDAIKHLILPAISLAFMGWAWILRVMRSSMLDELREDYINTAYSKGLNERIVTNKHALRNAMIPVVTISGFIIIGLLTGVVIVETVFNFKGIGWWFVRAAIQLDVPAVMGFTLFSGLIVVTVNLVVDVLYALINPKIRYD